MISKIIEFTMIGIIVVGGFVVSFLFNQNSIELLHYNTLIIVISLSGLSGLEGIFFSKQSAKSLGRQTNRPYQLQSGVNNLSVVFSCEFCLVYAMEIDAHATVLIMLLNPFGLIGSYPVLGRFLTSKNLTRKNAMRGVLILGLLIWQIPIIYGALNTYS
ncbi:DUF6790 family protein [Francisella noatunensis]